MAYSPGQELSSLAFDKIIGGALDAVVKAQNSSSLTTVSFIKNVGFAKDPESGHENPVYVDFKYPKEVTPYQPAVKTYIVKVSNEGNDCDSNNYIVKTANEIELSVNLTITDGKVKGAVLTNVNQLDSIKEQEIVAIVYSGKEKKDTEARLTITAEEKKAVPAQYQNMTLQVPLLTMVPIPFIRIDTTDIEFNVKINTMNTTSESQERDTKTDTAVNSSYKAWYSPVSVNASFNASIASQKKSSSTEEIKKEFSLNIKIHAVQDDMPAGMSRILDILEESIISLPDAK